MSTTYNRRRGAKANKPRTPRQCTILSVGADGGEPKRCIRLADGASPHCIDHRFRGPSLSEGPISRWLRLAHQARQSAEDARLKGKESPRLNAGAKARWKKLRAAAAMQTFLRSLLGVRTVAKIKRTLNPWAK